MEFIIIYLAIGVGIVLSSTIAGWVLGHNLRDIALFKAIASVFLWPVLVIWLFIKALEN